jgi:hypothetical protein
MRMLAGLLLTAAVAAAFAQTDDKPLREAASANGRFVLRITPGRPGRSGRACEATLTEQTERNPGGRPIWQRPLVNDVAPGLAFVRDDGRYVVTLDEHRRGGARHSLVIYGAKGELLRHFLLPDLLQKSDWQRVKLDERVIRWLDKARGSFDDDTNEFVLVLGWGREIHVDLKRLRIVGPDKDLDEVPPAMLAQMFDEEQEAPSALALSEQEDKRAQDVAAALTAPTTAASSAPPKVEVQATATTSAPQTNPVAQTHPASQKASAPRAAVATPTVPRPDPARPVDYVAWLNAQGRVAGPDAAPLYAAALAAHVAWTGDEQVLIAAGRGESTALHAPAVTTWLAANTAALRDFRAASERSQMSRRYRSADGSLAGIELPELAKLRSLARACTVEGRQLAAAGQSVEAAERYLAVLAAGAHVGGGMTAVENLVGLGMQAGAAEGFLDLQSDANTALDAGALAAELEAAYRPVRPVVEVLQSERATFLDALQHIWTPDQDGGPPRLDRDAARRLLAPGATGGAATNDTVLQEALNQLEQTGFAQTVAYGDSVYDALAAALAGAPVENATRIEQFDRVLKEQAQTNLLVGIFAPALGSYLRLAVRGEALRRGTLLVTRLQAYRQRNGSYPEALEALGQAEPNTDPYTGTYFEYRVTATGFSLRAGGAVRGKSETQIWPRRQ